MAALAVTELCRDNFANKSQAAELGSLSLLISQLSEGHVKSPGVQAEAAGAIWVLSDDHDANKVSFGAKGGIAPMVALLASENVRAQKHAAYALASLARGNVDNQSAIASRLVE